MHILLKRRMIIICTLLDSAIKMDGKPRMNDISNDEIQMAFPSTENVNCNVRRLFDETREQF